MTQKRTFCIHNALAILLSLSILVTGICLICGCLTIYFSGDQPYSREAVAEVFSKIAIPVYICIGLTVASIIWELISPLAINTKVSFKDYPNIIDKLSSKKDLSQNEALSAIIKEKALRKKHMIIRTIIICVSSIVFLCYALNGNNFHQSEINASMINAMIVMLPCLAVSFGYSVFTAYYNTKSYERELDLIKKLPAASESTANDTADHTISSKHITYVKFAIVVIAIAAIIIGYFAGGTADVLTKAINICTECIGLG